MKKKEEIKIKAKSSLMFKIILSAVVLLGVLLVLFLGKIFVDAKNMPAQKSTAVVVMEEDVKAELPSAQQTEESLPVVPEADIDEEIISEVLQDMADEAEDLAQIEAEETIEPVGEPDAQETVQENVEEFQEKEPAQEEISQSETEALLPKTQKYVAIVIDDMGISPQHTREIISIEAPLTSSFLTYGKDLDTFCEGAKRAGHEIIMHTPMEPKVEADLAPDTLKISMSDEEIRENFLNMLSKFEGFDLKGINNHMGSRFTESAAKLDVVMSVLKEKGLFFLDSKTSQYSQGFQVAQMEGVQYIERDVFLDNENDYEYVMEQLKETEEIAAKQGYAVAIGHAKSETYKALKDWVQTLEEKGLKLVHLSEMIEQQNKKN